MKTIITILFAILILSCSCTEEEISPKHYTKTVAKQSKVEPNEDGSQARPLTPIEK